MTLTATLLCHDFSCELSTHSDHRYCFYTLFFSVNVFCSVGIKHMLLYKCCYVYFSESVVSKINCKQISVDQQPK